MLGRFIDQNRHDVDALDRVIQAQGWKHGSASRRDVTCFIGHWAPPEVSRTQAPTVYEYVADRSGLSENAIPWRFDDLVERFGLSRVVRAIKLRCARYTLTSASVEASVPAVEQKPSGVSA